jgi:carbamoyl-phosphate synthase large subunit
MIKKFMLSSIGGDLSQSVARCLREDYQKCHLIGLDIHKEHSGSMFVDEFYLTVESNSGNFLSSLSQLIASSKPDFYFPLNDSELRNLSTLKENEWFKIFGETKVIWAGQRAIKAFSSKKLSSVFLNEIGVDTPKIYESSFRKRFNFPLIVKPNIGSGSKNVFLCQNYKELKSSLNLVKDPVIQEYIPYPKSEYTVGVFARNGEKIKSVAFRRNLSLGGNTSWCIPTYDPEIEKISLKIAKAINLNGSINIQLRKYNDKYFIFEVNPRFSSTVHIRSMVGFRDVLWSTNEKFDYSKFESASIDSKPFVTYSIASQLE